MGSQVSTTTQILVLVKGDRRMASQVSPTTSRILALAKRKSPQEISKKKKQEEEEDRI